MSAEAAQSSDIDMRRENAFVVESTQAGNPRQREEEEFEAERIAEARRTIESNARAGNYTRAKARRLGVDTIEGFKPQCAPYLKTEHLFERIDEESYEHESYGPVSGFLYGPCVLCGKTLEWLAAQPAHLKPNMFLCMEKGQKAAAMGYAPKQYQPKKAGGNGKFFQQNQNQNKR